MSDLEQSALDCICCANGNDLPDGEWCRCCERGVSFQAATPEPADPLALAIQQARGGIPATKFRGHA